MFNLQNDATTIVNIIFIAESISIIQNSLIEFYKLIIIPKTETDLSKRLSV